MPHLCSFVTGDTGGNNNPVPTNQKRSSSWLSRRPSRDPWPSNQNPPCNLTQEPEASLLRSPGKRGSCWLLLPTNFILFYFSRHSKEASQTSASWTERRLNPPLEVLVTGVSNVFFCFSGNGICAPRFLKALESQSCGSHELSRALGELRELECSYFLENKWHWGWKILAWSRITWPSQPITVSRKWGNSWLGNAG